MKWRTYPTYRDSGVEWLGDIPKHWTVDRLRRLSKRVTDGAHISPDQSGEDYPFVSIVDVKNGTIDFEGCLRTSAASYEYLVRNDCRPFENDVLFSKDGTVGQTALVDFDREFVVSSSLVIISPIPTTIQPGFLEYWLNGSLLQQDIALQMSGAALRRISVEKISRFPAVVPLLSEQESIVVFLDRETSRIDELIAKKQRQTELLQEKRSVLVSHVVTKGLDPNVKMKDSGVEWLGEIPAHWELVPLKFTLRPCGDAVKTGPFGSQLLSTDMLSGSIKVYNQRNVLDRDFISGENYITEDKFKNLSAFTIFAHDVLVTTRGTIGRCAVFPQNAEKGILHPCLMRIEPNASLSPDYLSLLIQDGEIVLLQLRLMSNSTTIDVIYSESLKSVRLPLPPIDEQRAIMTFLDRETSRIEQLIDKVSKSIDLLREYRSALISATVTGKIDVREEVA